MTFEEFRKVFQTEEFTERYFYGNPDELSMADGFDLWILYDNKETHKYEVYRSDGRGNYSLYESFDSVEDAYDYIIDVFRVVTKTNKKYL